MRARRAATTLLLLACALGALACSSGTTYYRGGVIYHPGYYGRGPWWGYYGRPVVIVDPCPECDIDPGPGGDLEATPLPEVPDYEDYPDVPEAMPMPEAHMPDMDMGMPDVDMDMGGFD